MATADITVRVELGPIVDALDALGAAMQGLADACFVARDKLEEADTARDAARDGED
jgi:hypothetical protein